MLRRLLAAGAVAVSFVATAPATHASTLTLSGSTYTFNGSSAADDLDVRSNRGPVLSADRWVFTDHAGTITGALPGGCTASADATAAFCTNPPSAVSLNGGDSADTLAAVNGSGATPGLATTWPSSIPLTISGGAGNDTLRGAASNDTISGNSGDDTINPGTGTDTVVGDCSGLLCPAGSHDVLDYTGCTTAVAVNLAAGTLQDGGSVGGVEDVTATDQGDSIVGSDSPGGNRINGAGGNDVLVGGGGPDTIDGGTGGDTIQGDNGAAGTDAADTINAYDGIADTVNCGGENDTANTDAIDTVVACETTTHNPPATPTPTPTPTPEPTPTTAPTATPAPQPAPTPTPAVLAQSLPKAPGKLTTKFSSGKRSSTVKTLTVSGATAGTTLTVTCTPKRSCPFAQKTYELTAKSRSLKTAFKRALKVGTKLTFTFAKSGTAPVTITLAVQPKAVART